MLLLNPGFIYFSSTGAPTVRTMPDGIDVCVIANCIQLRAGEEDSLPD